MPSSTTTTARSPSPAFSDSEQGPSRKRARTDMSNDERKEARAHRNRIAAQNSRDRRKAQFSYLERRVAELEEENRQLRVGMGISPTIAALSSAVTLQSTAAKLAEEEKQRAREKENEELKERIKTLEKGWEAVMKALTVQGFSPQTLQQQSSPSSVTPTPSVTTSMPPVSTTADSSTPVKVEELMTSSTTSFPISPAPSHTSLDFDIDIDTASSPSSIFSAGGLATLSYPSPCTTHDNQSTVDDATMESLFREILATSPALETANLPSLDAPSSFTASGSSSKEEMILATTMTTTMDEVKLNVDDTALVANNLLGNDNWVNDVEMHKLLESMAAATSVPMTQEEGSLPDLELGWDLAAIGVF
ncbi:hypothetical protein M378DRAFT_84759 [Amanita muscaria Koide BX008]|uniref:X-box-binding protein 1 n=1 Tax=Amanita muscaria (strain Koide BX008) TaxID=946122 RepID=A0A0C2WTM4_AMAMK|nr:hypothetical protein M378DRAFT_84759 [Amanita muscaria Koide BX008]